VGFIINDEAVFLVGFRNDINNYSYLEIKSSMMKDTVLNEKIGRLPDELKEQLSDYIDFSLYRYYEVKAELSANEKAELDNR
jgi:hypothetical protein